MRTPEEKAEHIRHIEQRKQQFVVERTAHARSLAQVAGTVVFTDPRGRAWGIKTFRIGEMDYFQRELMDAILRIEVVDNIKTRVLWGMFVQKCIVCADLYVGIKVKIRRALGLPDYSLRTIVKNLIERVPPTVVNTIIEANLDKKDIVDFLNGDKNANVPKEIDLVGWGDFMASYLYHKDIMPKQFFELTQPQLNAINDFMKAETERVKWEERRDRIRNGGR